MPPDGTVQHEASQDLHSPPYESMTSPSKEAEVDTDVLIDLSPEPTQTAPLPTPPSGPPPADPQEVTVRWVGGVIVSSVWLCSNAHYKTYMELQEKLRYYVKIEKAYNYAK